MVFGPVPELAYSFDRGFDHRQWLENRHAQNRLIDAARDVVGEQGDLARRSLGDHAAALAETVQDSDAPLAEAISQMHADLASQLGDIAEISALGFGMVRSELRQTRNRIGSALDLLQDALVDIGREIAELRRISENPEKTWSYEQFLESRKLSAVGDATGALKHIKLAIEGNATHSGIATDPRFYFLLGALRFGSSPEVLDLAEAETAFSKAASLARFSDDPSVEQAASLIMLANVQALKGDLPEALRTATTAKTLLGDDLIHQRTPEALDAQLTLAKIHLALGQDDAAAEALTSALAASPHDVGAAVLRDPDFLRRPQIVDRASNRLRDDAVDHATALFSRLEDALSFLRESALYTPLEHTYALKNASMLLGARGAIQAGSWVDIFKFSRDDGAKDLYERLTSQPPRMELEKLNDAIVASTPDVVRSKSRLSAAQSELEAFEKRRLDAEIRKDRQIRSTSGFFENYSTLLTYAVIAVWFFVLSYSETVSDALASIKTGYSFLDLLILFGLMIAPPVVAVAMTTTWGRSLLERLWPRPPSSLGARVQTATSRVTATRKIAEDAETAARKAHAYGDEIARSLEEKLAALVRAVEAFTFAMSDAPEAVKARIERTRA